VYFPEDSFESYFVLRDDGVRYINLNQFERTVADLSCCVLLFPEAPGSLVELGLFSGNTDILKKLMVISDRSHDDGKDSFISLGPVTEINMHSSFGPVFVEDFGIADFFGKIKNRLDERYRIPKKHAKWDVKDKKWDEVTYFEKYSFIMWLPQLLRVCSVDAAFFMAKSVFGVSVKKDEVVDLISILKGSGEIVLLDEGSYFRSSDDCTQIITPQSGKESVFDDLLIDVNSLCIADDHFSRILEGAFL
jgi:hypothetical protein